MARSAYHQPAFLGGEWSPLSQGRSDLPAYKQAMNVCLNGIPIEEGAWTRRSGFQFIAPTRNRLVAKLLPFMSSASSYLMEFTNLQLRMFQGTSPLFTTNHPTVTASSLASQFLTMTVSSASGFVVGDDVMLWAPSTLDYAAIGPFRNRVMQVTAISGSDITVGDETGAAFGAGVTSSSNALATCVLYQILRMATPWTGATTLANLRAVQAIDVGVTNSIILSSTTFPYKVVVTTAGAMSLAELTIEDGPYMDPQGDTGTVSAYTGTITFTPASTTFSASDVGRGIRLYSQPPAWSDVTTYAYGDRVTYNSEFWVSIAAGTYATSNVGVAPGTMLTSGTQQVTVWAPLPTAGSWAWGYIITQATTSCTVTIHSAALQPENGATITSWRLGLYTTGQYPTCGVYHGGRLWLGGAIENRFDASSANDFDNFSPTDQFGLVTDASAISRVLNSEEMNQILWMASDRQGVLMGTISGEWLISASTLNDPFTATSISADKVTKYGCAFVQPVRVGMVLAFVQRYGQRVIEYLADAFSGKYTGRHLNRHAKHITAPGVVELAYQEEKAPIIWARMDDGSLAGCTYRRTSRFVTEDPVFEGWHRQVLGGSYTGAMVRMVSSMAVLPNDDGLSDLLYVATSDTASANGAIEVMRPIFEDA